MRSIRVLCGSGSGIEPFHADRAKAIGKLLAQPRPMFVYGGRHIGLAGACTDATLEAGGRVVASRHRRKPLMTNLSSGFITLPDWAGKLMSFFRLSS